MDVAAKTPNIIRIENSISWAKTNLSWLIEESPNMGPKSFLEGVGEVFRELRDTRDPIWQMAKDTKLSSYSNGFQTPLFGEIEIASSKDEEIKAWLQTQLDEIERIVGRVVELASARGDIDEFPNSLRNGFRGDLTRLNRRREQVCTEPSGEPESGVRPSEATGSVVTDFAAR